MYDENSNASSAAAAVSSASVGGQQSNALVTQLFNVKDSRWLQVEVCREFQRGQCTRSDQECKFAHPPPHVDVQQGRVTACYDSIKGRCTRENPKCKYLHPPQHIKDQLLINGRNNLALKNLLCSQLNQTATGQPLAATVNPLAQIMAAQQQATQGLATASMVPTLPYPYYQQLVYSPLLGDPYQQQMPAATAANAAGLMPAGAGAVPAASYAALAGLSGSTPASLLQQHAALQQHAQAQQQAQFFAAAAAAAAGTRKRPLDEAPEGVLAEHTSTTPVSIAPSSVAIYNLAAAAAAASAAAAAAVPCKRPAIEKAGAGAVLFNPQSQQQAAAAAAAAAQQQFSPYLVQGIHGAYVPTVSFNGQAGALPPRF